MEELGYDVDWDKVTKIDRMFLGHYHGCIIVIIVSACVAVMYRWTSLASDSR